MPIDFVALAEAVGATGVRIDDPKMASQQFEQALDMPGPVMIEAVVDPVHGDVAGEDQTGAGDEVHGVAAAR